MSTSRITFALALALVSFPTAHALAWPTLDAETERTTVLGGRWSLTFGAEVTSTAAADPRGPTPRIDLDGIASMHDDEGRLAVRSSLMFATRPADLVTAVRALPAPCETPTVAPLADHENIVAVTCTEPSPDGAFRPFVIYATHTDGWVDRLEIQLELDEASDREAAIAFATAVAGSLRTEEVAPQVERGTVEIVRACTDGDASDALTLTLSDGWVATRHEGRNQSLVQLVQVVELGVPRAIASAVFLRVGAPPARLPAGIGAPHGGTLLGEEVSWLEVVGPDTAPGLREIAVGLTVACGGDAEPFTGTVQLSAGGPSRLLDDGTRVLETIALTSARGHTVAVEAVGTQAEPEPEADEAPATIDTLDVEDEEGDEAAERSSHLWSMAIGGVSLVLLALALILRARATRAK